MKFSIIIIKNIVSLLTVHRGALLAWRVLRERGGVGVTFRLKITENVTAWVHKIWRTGKEN